MLMKMSRKKKRKKSSKHNKEIEKMTPARRKVSGKI